MTIHDQRHNSLILSVPQQIWGVPASSSSYTYNTISAEDAAAMKEQVSDLESYLLSPTQKHLNF